MSVTQTIRNAGNRARKSETAQRLATKRPSRRTVAVTAVALGVIATPWLTGAHNETVELAARSDSSAAASDSGAHTKKTRAKPASDRKSATRASAGTKKAQAKRTVVQAAVHKQSAAPARTSSTSQAATRASTSGSGASASWYRGSYYSPGYESLRQCIVHRESRGNYQARNPSSGASGAYQFLLSTSNEVARRMGRPDLVGRPAGAWSHYDQDVAFWTLFDHGRGISHWGGRCG